MNQDRLHRDILVNTERKISHLGATTLKSDCANIRFEFVSVSNFSRDLMLESGFFLVSRFERIMKEKKFEKKRRKLLDDNSLVF